ncbi:hypothetical protein [Sulfuracidifex metallicus]|uniref:hypothetical protein n=1 Tax=Sulfuracidifex metallicus TaxID=47303 RepID=UPI0022724EAD|nr:hypothetical protein [Sulfuracidifex metallicus]MCY0849739.1 hypothetical protein [Sulfuracidifex metallicus]
METDLKLVKAVLDLMRDSVPTDCQDLIDELSKKIIRDLKEKGANKAMREWYGITDEDLEMVVRE